MVLEIKVPRGHDLVALESEAPVFLAYLLSFVFIGIYWNNHHHMLHATRQLNGWVLWANFHVLFWLSLVPVATGWLGENPSWPAPASVYGVLLLMAGNAFALLQRAIIAAEGVDSKLAASVGPDGKGRLSRILYASAIGLAFFRPWLAEVIYVLVAILWFAPDPRIEKALGGEPP